MSSKINLKYLKQGTVSIDTPANWDELNSQEKELYCSEQLNKCTDKEIITGMCDFNSPHHGERAMFDEIELAAISEDEEETYSFPSIGWLYWAVGGDVVGIINQGIANEWTKKQ